jgi:glycogen phosphorylase
VPDRSQLLAHLRELAGNLRWSFDDASRVLFEELDPLGWRRSGRDPVAMLDTIDERRLDAAVAHPDFAGRVRAAVDELEEYVTGFDTWYAASGGDPSRTVAYLSAEFALADCLRIYSGGLGALAGDHLRSASDLGLPLVAVGLAYADGYVRQHLDASGWQQESPAHNRFEGMPVSPVTGRDGQRLHVEVEMGDGTVRVAAWEVAVGRVRLFLLDTDVEGNADHHRRITAQLYGGDADTRLRQELVLGVGSVRLLAALGIAPAVYHLNEGHAAFAALERLRVHLDGGDDVEGAAAKVRDEVVFTTHTPVAAGHDVFDHGAAAWHLTPLADRAGVGFDRFWPLAADEHGRWSQTVLAVRTSRSTNGVARLHERVSRRLLAPVWGDRSPDEVPVGHVTNGVHPGRWVGPHLQRLYDWHLGPDWRTTVDPDRWRAVYDVDPAELWRAHVGARHHLVAEARARLLAQATRVGEGPDGYGLDPDALTIGFARRFTGYKRATLLARDVDRLARLVGDRDRPVQVLFAGKAHPRDTQGKHLIQDLVRLSRDPRFRGRIAFLEDYDLDLARLLVAGVDVWLNTPMRPLEASGTSGMKAAANGVLNASVLDGWWDEAVTDLAPRSRVGIGWVIGDRDEGEDHEARNTRDAEALYRVLEESVVPTFAERDRDGIPQGWVAMMQDAIALLAPAYSTHRMVVEYATQVYAGGPVGAGAGSTDG